MAKHPVRLLSFTSYVIGMTTPDRRWRETREAGERSPLMNLVTGLVGRRCAETTVLLAALAELLVDDDDVRGRCRQEVTSRSDRLPKWLVEPSSAQAYRAVRQRQVLSDGDEWAIGVRFIDGSELTVSIYLDHNVLSAATRIAVQRNSIDEVIANPSLHIETVANPIDESLSDARAWIARGLTMSEALPRDESWRQCRPLISWLIALMPDGGSIGAPGRFDLLDALGLIDGFFTCSAGAPFRDAAYRDLLVELCDTGSGDAARWSVTRIAHALDDPRYDGQVPLEVAVDAPALLRAFVPFAHAHSEVGEDLTDDAVATIDRMSLTYKRLLLDDAARGLEDDDVEQPPWLTRPDRAS
ncbi:hypothetical protein H7K45_12695 [Mycobacterium yunnanensis]|uniref:Uncharacterized protein n=1 Tax=Mycobacterium yunnanensis TaxID=368477 RepID=A0A9X3C334_9MYCO|nr:hypothetical protein [Mycobacterium yunnanensis]MCV7421402.1 hypothetical protein [Mycobacterium yunnanensis]